MLPIVAHTWSELTVVVISGFDYLSDYELFYSIADSVLGNVSCEGDM